MLVFNTVSNLSWQPLAGHMVRIRSRRKRQTCGCGFAGCVSEVSWVIHGEHAGYQQLVCNRLWGQREGWRVCRLFIAFIFHRPPAVLHLFGCRRGRVPVCPPKSALGSPLSEVDTLFTSVLTLLTSTILHGADSFLIGFSACLFCLSVVSPWQCPCLSESTVSIVSISLCPRHNTPEFWESAVP